MLIKQVKEIADRSFLFFEITKFESQRQIIRYTNRQNINESFLNTQHGPVMNALEILLKLFNGVQVSIAFCFIKGRAKTQSHEIIELLQC